MACVTFFWLSNSLSGKTGGAILSFPALIPLSVPSPVAMPAGEPVLPRMVSLLGRQMPMIVTLWLLGVILAVVRMGNGFRQLRAIRREKHRPLPQLLQIRLYKLKNMLALSRPVQLLGCRRIDTPVVIGHLRPVILLPLAMIGSVSLDQLEALIAHELAHIKRHDYLFNLIMRSLRILFFFNPGFLWLARYWENEREVCCDSLATELGIKPHCLAEALLGVRLQQRAWMGLTPAAVAHGSLRDRIRRLFGDPVRRNSGFGIGLPLLLIVLVAGIFLLGTPVRAAASEALFGLDLSLGDTEKDFGEKDSSLHAGEGQKDLKAMVEEMERLRVRIEALRKKKPGKERDTELARLEKQFTNLAGILLTSIPEPPPMPVVEVKPVEPIAPVAPPAVTEPVAPVQPPAPPEMSVAERLEFLNLEVEKLGKSLDETNLKKKSELLCRLKELQKTAEFSDQEKLAREYALQEEELERQESELKLQEEKLQRVKEREMKTLEEKLIRLEEEQRDMEKRLAVEENKIREFEANLTDYLLKHKLIRSTDELKDIEISGDSVKLDGKKLSESHHRAILKISEPFFGRKMKDPDHRIVIRR